MLHLSRSGIISGGGGAAPMAVVEAVNYVDDEYGSSIVMPVSTLNAVTGDLILGIAYSDQDQSTDWWTGLTAGYTKHREIGNGTSNCRGMVFWKAADGTETNVTCSGGSRYMCGLVMRISGADLTTPFNAESFYDPNGWQTIHLPALTTSVNNCLHLGVVGCAVGGSIAGATFDADWPYQGHSTNTDGGTISLTLVKRVGEEATAETIAAFTLATDDQMYGTSYNLAITPAA